MRLIDADAIEYDFNIKTYSENRIIVTKLLADKDTIDAVPTVNQWISVKDEMPPIENDEVLVNKTRVYGTYWLFNAILIQDVDGELRWYSDDNDVPVSDCDYWMPIPEIGGDSR